VSYIDLDKRRVALGVDEHATGNDAEVGAIRELPYDQLVLALGSVSNYLGLQHV
jgi:NADH dehydrogenase FAD-containing subunit